MEFETQLHEFNEKMQDYLCFPDIRRYTFALNEVHKYADWWLEEMGRLNAAVTTAAEGNLLYETYMRLVKELENNGDYLAATLVILRGGPVINRYGERPAEDELSIVIFDKITQEDKELQFIYDRQEIYEAFTRYEEKCRDRIKIWITEQKAAGQIEQDMETDLAFIQSVRLVRSLIYRDGGWFILQGKHVVRCIRACTELYCLAARVYRMAGHPDKARAVLHKAREYYKALLTEVQAAKSEIIASLQRKRNGTEDCKHGYSISIDPEADMNIEAEKECQRWLGTTEAVLKESVAAVENKLKR